VLPLAVVVCAIGAPQPGAQTPAASALLDRYIAGDFESTIASVAARNDYDGLLKDLDHSGVAWVDAGPPAQHARRELAAATFALEAARVAAETGDWKWVQQVRLNAPGTVHLPGIPPQTSRAADALWWKAPPRLVEWGCALLRRDAEPSPSERVWQLAAVATVERAGDFEFLVGSPWEERGNPKDEFEHLKHVIPRFPDEARFALAQAVAIESHTWRSGYRLPRSLVANAPDAVNALDHMSKDDAIGAEASLRLGYLRLRLNRVDDALTLFARVQTTTRDRYLIYLAHYFRGQALERKNQPSDAEHAYRSALATVPRAQSATMALAALLVRSNHPIEASSLVDASLTIPLAVDPWRGYEAADDRFWPELIKRLHADIGSNTSGEPAR
jgi:tetratricopeptide (TPR) repeat protein